MKNNSLITFDKFCPLIGHQNKSGFRLIMDDIDFKSVLNFLCDNFGEGVLKNGGYENDNWSIREGWRYSGDYEQVKPMGFRLLAFDKNIINKLFSEFNVLVPLDDTNTLEYYVRKAIKPLLFSKTSERRIRKLKHLIAAQLTILGHKIQWYNISYDWNNSTVYFNIADADVAIRLT